MVVAAGGDPAEPEDDPPPPQPDNETNSGRKMHRAGIFEGSLLFLMRLRSSEELVFPVPILMEWKVKQKSVHTLPWL
jgi:hypothetical protein